VVADGSTTALQGRDFICILSIEIAFLEFCEHRYKFAKRRKKLHGDVTAQEVFDTEAKQVDMLIEHANRDNPGVGQVGPNQQIHNLEQQIVALSQDVQAQTQAIQAIQGTQAQLQASQAQLQASLTHTNQLVLQVAVDVCFSLHSPHSLCNFRMLQLHVACLHMRKARNL